MIQIFKANSTYKKRARFLAILWTLLIFILCFIPGNELPDVKVPFIDKWAHVILFGIFSFLWLCANPVLHLRFLFILMLITIFMGWTVEYIQGHYIPGRTQDDMDTLADSAGGLIGILLFCTLSWIFNRNAARSVS